MNGRVITPLDPGLRGAFSLFVDESLWAGLVKNGAIGSVDLASSCRLGRPEVERLVAWAAGLDNPLGQRAAFARAIAELVTLGNGATVERYDERSVSGHTFWTASAQ